MGQYSAGNPGLGSFWLNRLYFCPFVWFPVASVSVSGISVNVGVAGDSGLATFRLGIYNASTTTGAPTTLVVDAGTVAADTTGLKSVTFNPVTLSPARYFFGIVWQQSSAATLTPQFNNRGDVPWYAYATSTAVGSGANFPYQQTGQSGALPLVSSSSPSGENPSPYFSLKVA